MSGARLDAFLTSRLDSEVSFNRAKSAPETRWTGSSVSRFPLPRTAARFPAHPAHEWNLRNDMQDKRFRDVESIGCGQRSTEISIKKG